MKVTLIAYTAASYAQMQNATDMAFISDGDDFADTQALLEFAGRACYQSWSKPNPETATNRGYLKNIIEQGHFSVLEHASVTFYVTGVSRSLTHELVRHRHLSFSQLSQRFVDESDVEFVVPPAVRDNVDFVADSVESDWSGSDIFRYVREAYAEIAEVLTEKGLPRKQVREAARAVLPNCTETKVVVTGNLRAWWEFIAKRATPAADAEIRLLALEIHRQLRDLYPNVFDLLEVGS